MEDPVEKPAAPRYPAGTGGFDANSPSLDGAALARSALAAGFGTATDDPYVLRGSYRAQPNLPIPGRRGPYGPSLGRAVPKTATLSRYNAEFFERWEDPNFQTWLESRRAAIQGSNASPGVGGAYEFWVGMGKDAAQARGVRWTPEQYIEYMANGGTLKGADEVAKDITTGAYMLDANGIPITFESTVQNPITTQRNVTYNTMNPLAANAAVDRMSQALLGRMATKGEMARLRGAINSILKKNPDVSTTTRDATDEDNVNVTTKTKAGMSASEAQEVVQMRMQRSSEGMAAGVGGLFEAALRAL